MTDRIIAPGIYPDISANDYFADPCPDPSLTQSLVKILLARSPAHARIAHPRLNPNFVSDDETKFDIGNVAHKLLIGRGKGIARVEFDSWQTKASKEARHKYAELGVVAALAHQYDRADEMVQAARIQLAKTAHGAAFKQGQGEAVIAWRDEDTWCRSMLDWLVGETFVYDYKTTAKSCAPHDMPERASTEGWDIQAAFHERGLDQLLPETAGRRRHYFVAQETEPPYALSILEVSEADLTLGRKKVDHAMTIWRDCVRRRVWPGYPPHTILSEPRAWTETKWLEREVAAASGRDARNLMAG